MGWWSTAVMGGDTPLDIQGDLEDHFIPNKIREELYEREPTAEEMQDFRTKLNALLKNDVYIEKLIDAYGLDDAEIVLQVVGVNAMRYGAEIPAALKERIIEAARADDWSHGDKERRMYMESFIRDVKAYDNKTPTELSAADRGLMFAIAEHIEGGKTGLVNKIKP